MVDYRLIRYEKDKEFFMILKEMIDLRTKPVKDIDTLVADVQGYLSENNTGYNYLKAFSSEDGFFKFFIQYYVKLYLNLIKPMEENYFKNTEKTLFHSTPLTALPGILKNRRIIATDKENKYINKETFPQEDFNSIFLSEDFIFSALMGLRYLRHSEFYTGTCILIPNTNNYGLYQKVPLIHKDNFYTNRLNSDLSVSDDDFEIIKKHGISEDAYNLFDLQNSEIFTKKDIPITDVKRIYMISHKCELIRIFNNIGNGEFESIGTDFINEILKGDES